MISREKTLQRIFRENYGVAAEKKPEWFKQFSDNFYITKERSNKKTHKDKKYMDEEIKDEAEVSGEAGPEAEEAMEASEEEATPEAEVEAEKAE